MNICVFCSSSSRIPDSYVDLAAEVGAEIARRGHGLVSGGGRLSCMGAVARTARAGGARTIGVIPDALVIREWADEDCDELLVVDTMRERKAQMERLSDAFLVLPGGIGTLEEMFEIYTARTLGMHDKPVVMLDADGVFSLLREQLDVLAERGFLRETARSALVWSSSVADAIDACEMTGGHRVPSAAEVLESEP